MISPATIKPPSHSNKHQTVWTLCVPCTLNLFSPLTLHNFVAKSLFAVQNYTCHLTCQITVYCHYFLSDLRRNQMQHFSRNIPDSESLCCVWKSTYEDWVLRGWGCTLLLFNISSLSLFLSLSAFLAISPTLKKILSRLHNSPWPKEAYSEVFPEDFSSPKRQRSYVFIRMPNLRQTGPPSTPLSTSQYSAVTSLSACNAFNPPWSITYRENLHLFLALTQFFPPRSNKPFTHVSRQWKVDAPFV